MSIGDFSFWASLAGAVTGAIVTAAAIAGAVRGGLRATIWRRRDHYARLRKLGVGAQLSFFIDALGAPPAIKQVLRKRRGQVQTQEREPGIIGPNLDESIFIDKHYYVQAVSDRDETVVAFSVTTRNRRFTPRFQSPGPSSPWARWRWSRRHGTRWQPPFPTIRLGKTRFPTGPPPPGYASGPGIRVLYGQTCMYSEFNNYGSVGNYLTYVFTASTVGSGAFDRNALLQLHTEMGSELWPPAHDVDGPPKLPTLPQVRRRSAISTITFVDGNLSWPDYPEFFGPHGLEVGRLG